MVLLNKRTFKCQTSATFFQKNIKKRHAVRQLLRGATDELSVSI